MKRRIVATYCPWLLSDRGLFVRDDLGQTWEWDFEAEAWYACAADFFDEHEQLPPLPDEIQLRPELP